MGEYTLMVEQILEHLNIDSYDARVDKTTWAIQRGSATIFILVLEPQSADEFGVLAVQSPIAKLPKKNLVALYRFLLEKNAFDTGQARFSITDDIITLCALRPLVDLDPLEMAQIIVNVGETADEFDDHIIKEFGAEKLEG